MKTTNRPLQIFVGLTALIGFGASASFYFREPANSRLADFPIITALHVVLGGVYLAVAPFQFLPQIRRRFLNYHRWAGRLLVVIGTVIGITATFMAAVIPFSGWTERVLVTPFAILFSISIVNGYRHVRAHDIVRHRIWMIRAFSIGLAIGTMRLIFFPILFWLISSENISNESAATASIVSLSTALTLHAVSAEIWIRRDKQQQTAKPVLAKQ